MVLATHYSSIIEFVSVVLALQIKHARQSGGRPINTLLIVFVKRIVLPMTGHLIVK